MPVIFVSKEVCEVRRMEGTFSAFKRMEARIVTAEEVKAAFSCLGLSCAQRYVQITREQAQQCTPQRHISRKKCVKRNGVSGHVRQAQDDVPQRLMGRSP